MSGSWKIYTGTGTPDGGIDRLPPPPPWRDFDRPPEARAAAFKAGERVVEAVNAALILRRPLLVTGPPGCGKSSLAEAVAHELQLGRVLRWSITSRSTITEGLYQYDALARLHDANLARAGRGDTDLDIGRYLRLGPLGTALLEGDRPRVLLIDEIDKSDLDLPNDLLHVFEEGEFTIPELQRLPDPTAEVPVLPYDGSTDADRVKVRGGRVHCRAFPLAILTSNGERELPPAFLRRCLRLDIPAPDAGTLRRILDAHLDDADARAVEEILQQFLEKRDRRQQVLATDQLLNAVFLVTRGGLPEGQERQELVNLVLRELGRR